MPCAIKRVFRALKSTGINSCAVGSISCFSDVLYRNRRTGDITQLHGLRFYNVYLSVMYFMILYFSLYFFSSSVVLIILLLQPYSMGCTLRFWKC